MLIIFQVVTVAACFVQRRMTENEKYLKMQRRSKRNLFFQLFIIVFN